MDAHHLAAAHLLRGGQLAVVLVQLLGQHQDDGELTATQKVRRREVMRIFEPLIEGIYR